MFRDLPSPVSLEEEVLNFWKDQNIFQKSIEQTRDRPHFVFYEGPPTANGMPHNGHVLTRVTKDLLPRYKTMQGFQVTRRAGWDTHGLPVEIEVEKELGVRDGGEHRNAREAVLAYGLENFSRKCIESVFKYTSEWEQLTERVGYWVDLDEAYVTYHKSYIESVWWALDRLFQKGLLYQGHKVVWWWPEGGTALSAHEVGEGYQDVDDPSVTVKFPVVGAENTYFLAWTTTPWTLPSNVALAVHPELDYAFVQTEQGVLIAAEALKPEGEVLKVVKGSELVGMQYTPLYDWAEPAPLETGKGCRVFEVVPGDHVTLGAGVGVVHTATGYGEADFDLGKQLELGFLQLVGPDGYFVESAPEWVKGMHFKAADKPIMKDLKDRGLLLERGTVRHSYPFSPRSKDDPLMQLARPGWFIRTTDYKDKALENNSQVNWHPEHIQEGRFGDFLRNNVDWALSRERFWGTPLNVWVCERCDHMQSYPSVAALKDAGATGFAELENEHLTVHRPWIDNVKVPCPKCSATSHRVPEVIDCWFDSGCMSFAQWGFPHQNVEQFKQHYPADFISEAIDQTRGWFYSSLMVSTMLFDDETCTEFGLDPVGFPRPYKNCVVLGHVCDMEGRKESKSKGNYTSPDLVLRGHMKMRVVEDDTLKPGTIGMLDAAVRSLDLGNKERMVMAKADGAEVTMPVQLKARKVTYGKETIGVHPADIEKLGLEGEAWLKAPFQPPGADAFRWLFYASNAPWVNTRLSLRAIREGQREFHLRLGNVYSFFSIYANINRFDPRTTPRVEVDSALDQWIRASFADLVNQVTEAMDGYQIFDAAKAITAFVDGLSNWYVRRSRSRFWGEGDQTSAALWTLYDMLIGLSKVIAPFVPFLAEGMYQRLQGPLDSVHLEPFPATSDVDAHARALIDNMALVRELVSLGLSARAQVGVRVRQPLRAVELILADPSRRDGLVPLLGLISDELNVREVHFSEQAETFVTFQVKPNFKTLGRRLGKDMKACAAAISQADPAQVRSAVLGSGYTVELPNLGATLLGEDDILVAVSPKDGFQAAGSADAVVVLHAELDDDLREEGLSREVINRIQTARKQNDLGYTDRIEVQITADDAVVSAVERFRDHIAHEVLATSLAAQAGVGADEIDGHSFEVTITKV